MNNPNWLACRVSLFFGVCTRTEGDDVHFGNKQNTCRLDIVAWLLFLCVSFFPSLFPLFHTHVHVIFSPFFSLALWHIFLAAQRGEAISPWRNATLHSRTISEYKLYETFSLIRLIISQLFI